MTYDELVAAVFLLILDAVGEEEFKKVSIKVQRNTQKWDAKTAAPPKDWFEVHIGCPDRRFLCLGGWNVANGTAEETLEHVRENLDRIKESCGVYSRDFDPILMGA